MKKTKSKKKYVIISIVLLVVIGGGYLIFGRDKAPEYDFVLAIRKDIINEVGITGRVKPARDVDLAFEKAGKVSNVYVDVGDHVYSGQLLAKLNNVYIQAQVEGAKADLKVQQAKLDELKAGTREEEIKVQEVKVENARTALIDEQQTLADTVGDAFTKADDAIRNKVDQFFSNPRGDDPKLSFSFANTILKNQVETGRVEMKNILNEWDETLVKENLDEIKSFLENIALVVNDLKTSSTLSQITIDGWRADVSTARTNINTAITNISTAEEGVRTAESTLALEEEQLVLKKAGTIEEQIAAQEAQIDKAAADIKKFEADLAKTFIYSPMKGIITSRDLEVGETVSANSEVVSVISEANFEIKSDVPEVDVAKIKIGDVAEVTLDAYGDDVVFSAVVVEIEPAETIIEGVPSYGTTLQFSEEDTRIRSGMTANIDILIERHDNVVVVPQRAVITKNGNKFTRVLREEEIIEMEVETGLKNSYGEIEIVSGVNEGDKIITFYGTD